MNLLEYILDPGAMTISHIPCSLHHTYSLYIFCWYLTIIATLNSLFWPLFPTSPTTAYFSPSYFKSCSTTYLFHKPKQYLNLIFPPSNPRFIPSVSSLTGRSCGLIGHLFIPYLPAGEIWEICGYACCYNMINWRERYKKMDERLGTLARIHCPD